jgi:ankyrin repeat protein
MFPTPAGLPGIIARNAGRLKSVGSLARLLPTILADACPDPVENQAFPGSPRFRQSVYVVKTRRIDGLDDGALLALFRAIALRDRLRVERWVAEEPGLATGSLRIGASRQDPDTYFLQSIHHHVYAGDTGLHIAAAAHQQELAGFLVAHGADIRARNRRGAEPLHYAADGRPGALAWDRDGQRQVITYLIEEGADPDAIDKSGVAPLHRAVRTRGSHAVRALIESGANPRLMNKSGSTPLHLAVQNTGKGNSGSDVAKKEQRQIIVLLLEYGASRADVDANGKTVAAAASSDWIRQLLGNS